MNEHEQARCDALYQRHRVDLKLHGNRSTTAEAYSRTVRRLWLIP